jgi:hypothetical protein
MIELIIAIATLCQTNAGGETARHRGMLHVVHNYQLECQQYYLKCEEKTRSLKKCILDKKPTEKEQKYVLIAE